jgi:hypothetical protein
MANPFNVFFVSFPEGLPEVPSIAASRLREIVFGLPG